MDRKTFFDHVRPMFGGRILATQVSRVEAVLDGIEQRKMPIVKAAYVLATAHHESDQWKALTEYASGKAYEGRADLGNTRKGDGVKFKGRGFVMITGRRNYTDWAKRLGVDIVAKPHLVAAVKYAVPILIDGMILGTFTTKKLSDYFTANRSDWINARRIVNGLDKASLIATHAKGFHAALMAATEGDDK